MRYQTAKIRSRSGIAYIIGCNDTQTEDEILKYASDFYETEMISIERRTNIGK
jgi:hypothetical protein